MNSVEVFQDPDVDSRYILQEPVDEERRIRQGMRVGLKTRSTKITRVFPPNVAWGAALIAGGFCLGWKAFRVWRG